jgi:hypothetical protein
VPSLHASAATTTRDRPARENDRIVTNVSDGWIGMER